MQWVLQSKELLKLNFEKSKKGLVKKFDIVLVNFNKNLPRHEKFLGENYIFVLDEKYENVLVGER